MLSAGLLGADLNIPTFGWISSDSSVGDKDDYTTLVRLLYPAASIGQLNVTNQCAVASVTFLIRFHGYTASLMTTILYTERAISQADVLKFNEFPILGRDRRGDPASDGRDGLEESFPHLDRGR